MIRTLGGLVAELRAVGLPVSPTEHIDAANALQHTSLEDRAAVKAALAATMVKDSGHWQAFSTVFDLYFAGRRGDLKLSGVEDGGADGDPAAAGQAQGQGLLGGAGPAELAELLYGALRDDDRLMQQAIAGELISRFAGIEPGRRSAGVLYQIRALRPVNLDALLDRLLAEPEPGGGQAPDGVVTALERRARVDRFRAEVEDQIRERMVADRGPEDVARTLRTPLPEDIDFLHASKDQAAAIREALNPLARKIAARLARKRRSRKEAPLDFRQTMRRSLSTGGTPVELVFRKPHPSRPELIVIADISGSVAPFAVFTIQLVYALRSQFARVRCFVFVDGVDEVTELIEKADSVAEVMQQINRDTGAVWLSGRSDYGNALRMFQRRYGDQIRSRSTVLVLGDARNNYLHPREESLAAIADKARALYWLNPERVTAWNDGDSIIGRYAKHCDAVFECRNVRQLRQFVEHLE